MALVIFLGLLLVGGSSAGITYLAMRNEPRLKRRERKELERLRKQESELIHLCMDNMDVERFAFYVYDIIRTNNIKELG